MPIEPETGAYAARLVVGTLALKQFSEWVWDSYKQIPRRLWFLIPWVVLYILGFIAQT